MILPPTCEEAYSPRCKDSDKLECVRTPAISTSPISLSCHDEPSDNCLLFSANPPSDSPDPSPCLVLSDPDALPERALTPSCSQSEMSPSMGQPLRIKRGFKDMLATLTCGVLFESDPVWLWSLRINSWSAIFLTASNDSELRRCHPVLRSLLEPKIVVIPSTFGGDFPSISPEVMLISGDRPFLSSSNLPSKGVHIFWMSHSPRRCPSDLLSLSWSRVSHCKVGGVTDARGTFGVSASSPDILLKPDIQRTLSHVLKHSIRPRPCDPDLRDSHYDPSDLLSLSFPHRPILYPSFMSRTGWGVRSLSEEELSVCFELPSFVPWDYRFLRDIVPIQLFRSVLDHVTDHILPSSPPPKRVLRSTPGHDVGMSPTSTDAWLPSIGRWLPGSWADAVIASKAVKSDNSPIDFKPWRRRIQLRSEETRLNSSHVD